MKGSMLRGARGSWSWSHTDAVARLLAIALLAFAAGWVATSSLQQDFAAYYAAGTAVARGLDPYVNHVGAAHGADEGLWDGIAVYRHSRFLYAPLVAHLFRPLAALPFAWAKAIFTALSLGGLWVALVTARRAPAEGPTVVTRSPWVLGAAWSPVFLTLERGQVDLMLLALLAAAWRFRRQAAVAGALTALVVLVKPAVLGVLPVLVAGRHHRWAVAMVVAVAVLLGLNVGLAGRAATGRYLSDVLPRAARYGEGGPAEWLLAEEVMPPADADAGEGRTRRGGRTYALELGTFRRNASLPRLLAGDGEPSVAATIAIAAVLLGAAAWAARRAPDTPFAFWAGLVAVTLSAPVSWAMGLVWALPVLALIPLGARWQAPAAPPIARRLCLLAFVAALVGPLLPAAWIAAGAAAMAAAVVAAAASGPAAPPPEAAT